MIIEKAADLGIALSNSEEFKRMQAVKAAMDADAAVNSLMKQYTSKQEEMVSMLENATPDGTTVSDISRELEDIQNTLMGNPVFGEMLEAQQQFANLMNQVNKIIGAYIGLNDGEEEASSSCSGNCQGCSGCVH